MKNLFKQTNKLGIAILILFFAQATFVNAQSQTDEEKVYIKIEIDGMACAYCAFGMEKELKEVSGVDKVAIELKEGLAFISTPKSQKPEKENLSLIIQNAGFTPGNIEFSDKPFKTDVEKRVKKKE